MRVLVFEDNLMWSSRLVQSIRGLGHEPVLYVKPTTEELNGDAAILNLASVTFPVAELVATLRLRSIPIVAHAGHKEKELMALGATLGVEKLATNSELTFKLPEILASL